MAVQLHAPTRLQATKTLPLPSLLAPNGNNVGLTGPADRFALKSSFFSPSLHLLIASYNQQQSLASAAPRFSMRAATKQAYICRDCGKGKLASGCEILLFSDRNLRCYDL
ncbi:hypothetical protein OIU76_022725 [Salix suchowensis]|nr:hypothetical protein OIU76_022725 [Salix suchowensis]